jgi:hypothetical protein
MTARPTLGRGRPPDWRLVLLCLFDAVLDAGAELGVEVDGELTYAGDRWRPDLAIRIVMLAGSTPAARRLRASMTD